MMKTYLKQTMRYMVLGLLLLCVSVCVQAADETERGLEYTIYSMGMYDIETYEEYHEIPQARFMAEVCLTNESSTHVDAILLVQYDIEGQMLGLDYLYGKIGIGDSSVFGTIIDNTAGNIGSVKAFVVPRVGSMVPLANAMEIGQKKEAAEQNYVYVKASQAQPEDLLLGGKALVKVMYLDGSGMEVLSLQTRDGADGIEFLHPNGTWVAVTEDATDIIECGFYRYSVSDDDEIILSELGEGEMQLPSYELGTEISANGSLELLFGTEQKLMDSGTELHIVYTDKVETFRGFQNIDINEDVVKALMIYDGECVEKIYIAHTTAYSETETPEQTNLDGYVFVTDSAAEAGEWADHEAKVKVLHMDGSGYVVYSLKTNSISSSNMEYFAPDGSWVSVTEKTEDIIPCGFYGYYLTEDGDIILMDLGTNGRGEKQILDGSIVAKATEVINFGEIKYLADENTVLYMVRDTGVEVIQGYKNIDIQRTDVKALCIYDGVLAQEIYVIDDSPVESETFYAYYNGEFEVYSDEMRDIMLYTDEGACLYPISADITLAEGIWNVELDGDEIIGYELVKAEPDESDWYTEARVTKVEDYYFVVNGTNYYLSADVQIYDLTDGYLASNLEENDYAVWLEDEAGEVIYVYIIGRY